MVDAGHYREGTPVCAICATGGADLLTPDGEVVCNRCHYADGVRRTAVRSRSKLMRGGITVIVAGALVLALGLAARHALVPGLGVVFLVVGAGIILWARREPEKVSLPRLAERPSSATPDGLCQRCDAALDASGAFLTPDGLSVCRICHSSRVIAEGDAAIEVSRCPYCGSATLSATGGLNLNFSAVVTRYLCETCGRSVTRAGGD